MALWSDFLSHNGRLAVKWKHYFPAYQRHLARFVDQPTLLVEIGCGEGGSLQMWKKFLGPYASIVGIDTRPECKAFEEDQISVRIGSQADTVFLQSILDEFGVPNVVLDDGSHRGEDQCASFVFLYPKTDRAGVYVVEDLHTSYWSDHGGGLRQPGTFIELCKSLIDQLNGNYTDRAQKTAFTDSTLSMHFYDSMAFFERGTIPSRTAPRAGGAGNLPAIVFQDRQLRRLNKDEIPKQYRSN
jgi:hypothetical protein